MFVCVCVSVSSYAGNNDEKDIGITDSDGVDGGDEWVGGGMERRLMW